MRLLIYMSLALTLAASGASLAQAQSVGTQSEIKGATANAIAVGPPRSQTTGGTERKPEPHIYKLGDHLSTLYGTYSVVEDWAKHDLKKPPAGQHWVRYEDNYLLVSNTDGLIREIVKAT